MIDYQWPHPTLTSADSFVQNKSDKECRKLINDIENHFKNIFETEVILVPSGRSAISILLKYFNLNRSHTVFAPKWTSHCVWDVVTRLTNPTSIYGSDCDLVIAVHKWGIVEKISRDNISLVIEDSVDSIITSSETLFPNDGDVEIFSLPKIMGCYTGGLIVVKNKKTADDIRDTIIADDAIAGHQSRLRFDCILNSDRGFSSWEHNEHRNTSLDYNGLVSIKNSLPNYDMNRKCISDRLETVMKKFKDVKITLNRLPPVVTLDVERYNVKNGTHLMIRNRNISGLLDQPNYKKVYLLPLHFGVKDRQFDEMLNCFDG